MLLKKSAGKLKDNRGNKKQRLQKISPPLTTYSGADRKQSNSWQINIKPHIIGLVPFTQYVMFGFLQKNCKEAKRHKMQSERINQTSEPDSDMAQTLE